VVFNFNIGDYMQQQQVEQQQVEQLPSQQQGLSQSQLGALQNLIRQYKINPDAFDSEEVMQIKQYADMAGIPFSIPFSTGRAIGRAVGEFADTLALGMLPDSWTPKALNSGEEAAGQIGSLLSLFVPGIGGAAIGAKAAKGVATHILPKLLANAGKEIAATGKVGQALNKVSKIGELLQSAKAQERFLGAVGGAVTGAIQGQPLENGIDFNNVGIGALLGGLMPLKRFTKSKSDGTPIPEQTTEAQLKEISNKVDDTFAESRKFEALKKANMPPYFNPIPSKPPSLKEIKQVLERVKNTATKIKKQEVQGSVKKVKSTPLSKTKNIPQESMEAMYNNRMSEKQMVEILNKLKAKTNPTAQDLKVIKNIEDILSQG